MKHKTILKGYNYQFLEFLDVFRRQRVRIDFAEFGALVNDELSPQTNVDGTFSDLSPIKDWRNHELAGVQVFKERLSRERSAEDRGDRRLGSVARFRRRFGISRRQLTPFS